MIVITAGCNCLFWKINMMMMINQPLPWATLKRYRLIDWLSELTGWYNGCHQARFGVDSWVASATVFRCVGYIQRHWKPTGAAAVPTLEHPDARLSNVRRPRVRQRGDLRQRWLACITTPAPIGQLLKFLHERRVRSRLADRLNTAHARTGAC